MKELKATYGYPIWAAVGTLIISIGEKSLLLLLAVSVTIHALVWASLIYYYQKRGFINYEER